MKDTLDAIIESAIDTLGITKAIGYAVTGSSILDVVDGQADTDIAIITLDERATALSNIINFYLPQTEDILEILIEDIFHIKKLEESYGYSSWINYLIPRRENIIWQNYFKEKFIQYNKLLIKFRSFWIHGMLKGYEKDLKKLKQLLEAKNLSIATKKELKELYHVGFTYNEDFIDNAKIDLLKAIKRKHLDKLVDSDYDWLLSMLENRINSYLIVDSAKETELFNNFLKELENIWK